MSEKSRCGFALPLILVFLFSAAMVGTLDPKDTDRFLAGVWVDEPYVAESNCHGLLLLFSNHKFAMNECLVKGKLCQKTETIGEWTYRGKVLKLAVTKRAKFTSKWHEYDASTECEGCCYAGVIPVVKLFSTPYIRSFSCIPEPGGPDPSAKHGSHSWEMTMNGKRYWMFNAKIEEFCEMILLAAEICRE